MRVGMEKKNCRPQIAIGSKLFCFLKYLESESVADARHQAWLSVMNVVQELWIIVLIPFVATIPIVVMVCEPLSAQLRI